MTAEPSSQPASDPVQLRATLRSWPRAALLTAGAIYGPQLLMCLYTLGFVACSHCKAGVWQLAPIVPGLFFYEWGRRLLDLPHFSGAVGVALSIVISLLVCAVLTLGVRQAGHWRAAILIPVLFASAIIAVALLSAMRA